MLRPRLGLDDAAIDNQARDVAEHVGIILSDYITFRTEIAAASPPIKGPRPELLSEQEESKT
jgi:hypothetical protein